MWPHITQGSGVFARGSVTQNVKNGTTYTNISVNGIALVPAIVGAERPIANQQPVAPVATEQPVAEAAPAAPAATPVTF